MVKAFCRYRLAILIAWGGFIALGFYSLYVSQDWWKDALTLTITWSCADIFFGWFKPAGSWRNRHFLGFIAVIIFAAIIGTIVSSYLLSQLGQKITQLFGPSAFDAQFALIMLASLLTVIIAFCDWQKLL